MTFNGNRLRLGRLFQDWTQRELAERVAVSHAAIAFFEKGLKVPRGNVLDALAVVLKVQPEFFSGPDIDEFRDEETNFRRRIAASERQRKQVLAHGSLFATLAQHLQQEVSIPALGLPSITPRDLDDVDRVADDVRRHFGIPLDVPLGSVARLLENAGVLLLAVDMETAKRIDAFSRYGTTSVVVLNTEKDSASRTLFEEAHELAHGVMHRSGRVLSLDQREAEANRFAGALLLPRAAFSRDAIGIKPGDWTYLFEMKRHWGPSVKAILYRAYQLGFVDAADFRTRMRYYSYRGWNDGEPDEPERDEPRLFSKLLTAYCDETSKTYHDIASDLAWTDDLFSRVTGIQVPGDTAGIISLTDFRSKEASPKTKAPTS